MDPDETSDDLGPDTPTAVVGVGASAGGLASLKEFFSALPGETGAAFVVIRHLDPDEPTLGPELVSEHSGLPVQEAEDGHRLGRDEVAFLPPGAALRVEGGDGEAALETAREFGPEVVLCDLGLPGSMDGNDVAHALRSDGRLDDARLVAVSGYGQQADRERSLAAGFDAYLVKPIRDAELMETLAALFRERS